MRAYARLRLARMIRRPTANPRSNDSGGKPGIATNMTPPPTLLKATMRIAAITNVIIEITTSITHKGLLSRATTNPGHLIMTLIPEA